MKHTAVEISVLMTVFNTESYLTQAIESLLQQSTHRSWELIVVDDGSTDSSREIAERYAALHPDRIRVLSHAGGRNCGISASRNLALQHARGSLIGFLDSDDVFLPHHLETLASILDKEPEAAMVYACAERWTDYQMEFNEAAARSADWGSNYIPPLVPAGECAGLLPRGTLLQWFLEDESKVPCICAVLVRAHSARAVDGFCNAFQGLYDDQVFHARVSTQFHVYAVDVCVARYRQRPGSCCRVAFQRKEEQQRFYNVVAALTPRNTMPAVVDDEALVMAV